MEDRAPRPRVGTRTCRQRHGAEAEDLAAEWLQVRGWTLVERNVRIGRDEIDIVAIDHGPPDELVCVEVRSVRVDGFGAPEERVDARKVNALYRACRALAAARREVDAEHGVADPPRCWRVDLVSVDWRARPGRGAGRPEIRHLRGVTPR